ncbi:MAG: rod-binding protein [Fimbriimonadaceae bacterium]|nr:rod-binding protein [Fimbriimonadaceae bacterium]
MSSPVTGLGGMMPQGSRNLRPDFHRMVEAELERSLGQEGSEIRERMSRALSGVIDPATGRIDLDRLSEASKRELTKLQTAAEGFEAVFAKQLFSQMRKSSFSEKTDKMGEFARDTLDQALADRTSQSPNGLGIATTLFRATAPLVIRQALAESAAQPPTSTEQ